MNSIMIGNTTHVPAFLVKLWRIVDDPSTNNLIRWSDLGNSFIIHNQSKFSRELLPLYYKHNNMASFVRQLNMYGFHKVISVEQGGLRVEKEEMEFAHPYFLCGQESSLELIKRKISTSKMEESRNRPENYNKQVLIDVRQMKGRQETMDTKLLNMKRENEALWRELAVLRQKHVKQQQIVSKLLQFLVSMMSTQSHRIGFKRRLPLMLADADEGQRQNVPKVSRSDNPASAEGSPEGPVIHDVTEEEPFIILSIPNSTEGTETEVQDQGLVSNLLTRAAATLINENNINADQINYGVETEKAKPRSEFTEQQPENILSDLLDADNVILGTSNIGDTELPTPTVAELLGLQYPKVQVQKVLQTQTGTTFSDMVLANESTARQHLDEHLGEMNHGLTNLKDLLQGGEYNLDMDTLSGLFGHSSDILGLSGQLNANETEGHDQVGYDGMDLGGIGSEMVPYNPCLFELAEDDTHFFEDSPNPNFLNDELESMLTTDKSQLTERVLKS